jgi:hypothetical protein
MWFASTVTIRKAVRKGRRIEQSGVRMGAKTLTPYCCEVVSSRSVETNLR